MKKRIWRGGTIRFLFPDFLPQLRRCNRSRRYSFKVIRPHPGWKRAKPRAKVKSTRSMSMNETTSPPREASVSDRRPREQPSHDEDSVGASEDKAPQTDDSPPETNKDRSDKKDDRRDGKD